MKKISISVIAVCIIIGVVLSFIAGMLICAVLGETPFFSKSVTMAGIALFPVLMICYVAFSGISEKISKKTMKKLDENQFHTYSTYYTKDSVLKIDVQTGLIAYVSDYNPFELQVKDAVFIDNIKADYVHGVLGGTNYVYFSFCVNGKELKFPTFTSRNQYSLQAPDIIEAIEKANKFAGYIAAAKNAAVSRMNQNAAAQGRAN